MLPLVISVNAQRNNLPCTSPNGITTEDPLPHALELTGDGCVLSRGTYVTEVARETTDDN